MTEQDILKTLEDTDALLNGHFELRSGLHSNRFFQCANLLRFPRIAGGLCEALVQKLEAAADTSNVTAVISPALGGIIVGHEVARSMDKPCIFAEKLDDKLVMRRFKIKPGERYVVAEDVITRGGRVQETIDLVEGAGAEVAAILVLVDRSAGKAKFDAPLYSLLQMSPEVWDPEDCPMCAAKEPFVHPGS
ncbi:MAG: orotate phosphoribosyltransferase [Kiritimatiellae bacterium]|jgi:orotate phosphoribosyltransferase|nr:orotate phosphoribosyltransferase [Kiritimatiellia bacterium]